MKKVKMVMLISLTVLGIVYAGRGPEEMIQEENNKLDVLKAINEGNWETWNRLENNKTTVMGMIKAVNEGDWETWKVLVAEDFVQHGPRMWKPAKREDVELAAREVKKELSGIVRTIDDLVAEGNKVVARITYWVRAMSKYESQDDKGRIVLFTENSIMRIAGGKIVEEWVEYDWVIMKQNIRLAKARRRPHLQFQ